MLRYGPFRPWDLQVSAEGEWWRFMQVLTRDHAPCVVCGRYTRWLDVCGDLGPCCSIACHEQVFWPHEIEGAEGIGPSSPGSKPGISTI